MTTYIVPAPELVSLEPAILVNSAGIQVDMTQAGIQRFDLNGKSLLTIHAVVTASDGSTASSVSVGFSNAPDPNDIFAANYYLSPSLLFGGSAGGATSYVGNGVVSTPADPAFGAMDSVIVFEDIPFRYVQMNFGGMATHGGGARSYATVYAR